MLARTSLRRTMAASSEESRKVVEGIFGMRELVQFAHSAPASQLRTSFVELPS